MKLAKNTKKFLSKTFLDNVIFYQILIYVFENFVRSPLTNLCRVKALIWAHL